MRTLLAVFAVAILGVSCAHPRVAAYAGEDRTLQSGVPARFAGPAEPPEGTQVLWDFGDGTAAVKGSPVEHAFPRAGQFTVTQTTSTPTARRGPRRRRWRCCAARCRW